MINKCPHCGFEPLEGKMVCPRCGEEIKENIAGKLATIKENNRENNDSVKWSDFKDVSIGSVMEESLNEATKEDDLADVNPILADYIKKHKDDYEEDESTPAVKQTKAEDKDEKIIAGNEEAKEELSNFQSKNEEIDESKKDSRTYEKDTAPSEEPNEEQSEAPSEALNEEPSEESQKEAKTISETTVSKAASVTKKTTTATDEIKVATSKDEETEADHMLPKSTLPTKEQTDVDQDKKEDAVLPSEASKIPKETEKNEIDPAALNDNNKPTTSKAPKKKWPYVLLAAVLVLGGGVGYYGYDQSVKATAQKEQQQIEKQETVIQNQLADFYTDKQQQFVKADKTSDELTDLTAQVKELTQKASNTETKDRAHHLTNEIGRIKEKIATVTRVNNLFESPIISGDQVKKDIAIKGDAINVEVLTAEDEFAKTINGVISEAKSQFNDLTSAQKAVAVVYADNKVKDKATRTQYQAAQKAVAKLVDGNQKQTLVANLKKVDAELGKEEAAAAKKKQEQAEAEAAANAAKKAQSTTSSQNSQAGSLPAEASPNMRPNTDNAPIMATNPSAVADSANPAWVWNSGIQEKVIQTCIDRGYIVAGGYYLEPVTIENGEGYYNLYATNTQSSLLKGISAKALPYYIVTINCKTGYFRGNGNDHTIR